MENKQLPLPLPQASTARFSLQKRYEYSWGAGPFVTDEIISELANLYSSHYGVWSTSDPDGHVGRVRLSKNKIKELLSPTDSQLAFAKHQGQIIGYAIAIQSHIPDCGIVSWVTQLVVHEEHRQIDIGKNLLFSMWKFTDHFAWGVLTANPYAVRALEKATRRRCNPLRILPHWRKLKSIALKHIPYVTESMTIEVTGGKSRINTRFFVDHSQVPSMLKDVTKNTPWLLGKIEEGWEWFAFTFHDQEEIGLTSDEIENMLKVSDEVARTAYSRMLLNTDHRWAAHSKEEARFIVDTCKLKPGDTILDFGCGKGRHALELAKVEFEVIGIDYVIELISHARKTAKEQQISKVNFKNGDCRTIDIKQKFDAVICLYDVVGSFADINENAKIVGNIFYHLKPGGTALISVMNYELTRRKATQFFSLKKDPNKLLSLRPSQTMERTGDVFNPDYYMIDTDTEIIYRKEQFAMGDALPAELIVRDHRYTIKEIENVCRIIGFNIEWAKFVRAGNWNEAIPRNSDQAKEILICCTKPTKS